MPWPAHFWGHQSLSFGCTTRAAESLKPAPHPPQTSPSHNHRGLGSPEDGADLLAMVRGQPESLALEDRKRKEILSPFLLFCFFAQIEEWLEELCWAGDFSCYLLGWGIESLSLKGFWSPEYYLSGSSVQLMSETTTPPLPSSHSAFSLFACTVMVKGQVLNPFERVFFGFCLCLWKRSNSIPVRYEQLGNWHKAGVVCNLVLIACLLMSKVFKGESWGWASL